jgi:hypothetical protein
MLVGLEFNSVEHVMLNPSSVRISPSSFRIYFEKHLRVQKERLFGRKKRSLSVTKLN